MKKGKLIVIDGSDSVGKATQTRLLVSRLRREGRQVATLDFPQYDKNFFGKFIKDCLQGRYGDFIKLDPHIASVLYAADRFESKKVIEEALRSGKTVVIDRYVSSNQMHQGGKIKDNKKRKEFLQWLDTLEHRVFGIPRPDAIVYLDLPVKLSSILLTKKGHSRDMAERRLQHQRDSQKGALMVIKGAANGTGYLVA